VDTVSLRRLIEIITEELAAAVRDLGKGNRLPSTMTRASIARSTST